MNFTQISFLLYAFQIGWGIKKLINGHRENVVNGPFEIIF